MHDGQATRNEKTRKPHEKTQDERNHEMKKLIDRELKILSEIANCLGLAVDASPGRDGFPGEYVANGVQRKFTLSGANSIPGKITISGSSRPMSETELKEYFAAQLAAAIRKSLRTSHDRQSTGCSRDAREENPRPFAGMTNSASPAGDQGYETTIMKNEDPAKAVPHLAFDFFHFRFYSRRLKDGSVARCSPAVRQAVLYSLLLHFRVLWDFFYEKPGKDDCGVDHFRVLPEFASAFPTKITKPAKAETLSKNLNKRLAHMTATRWREPQPDMSFYQRYFEDIERLITAFQDALPAELRRSLVERMQKYEVGYGERL